MGASLIKRERFKKNLSSNLLYTWNELPEKMVEAGTITTLKDAWTSTQIGRFGGMQVGGRQVGLAQLNNLVAMVESG